LTTSTRPPYFFVALPIALLLAAGTGALAASYWRNNSPAVHHLRDSSKSVIFLKYARARDVAGVLSDYISHPMVIINENTNAIIFDSNFEDALHPSLAELARRDAAVAAVLAFDVPPGHRVNKTTPNVPPRLSLQPPSHPDLAVVPISHPHDTAMPTEPVIMSQPQPDRFKPEGVP
jgi:hypothetical protein